MLKMRLGPWRAGRANDSWRLYRLDNRPKNNLSGEIIGDRQEFNAPYNEGCEGNNTHARFNVAPTVE